MHEQNQLDKLIQFSTNTATLAVFDPYILQSRIQDAVDWWTCDFNSIEEVSSGLISLISLTADGFYKVRVTNSTLTQSEKDFARQVLGPMGVISKSGSLFIGSGESLPGAGQSITKQQFPATNGAFVDLPVGNYYIELYYINASRYASKKLIKSLPDFVITIIPKIEASAFVGTLTEPRIDTYCETFLFASPQNAQKLKPKLNKKLKAKVFKSENAPSGLILKPNESWPDDYSDYEIILQDMSQIKWKDRIIIQTVSLDEKNKIIYAQLIEKDVEKPIEKFSFINFIKSFFTSKI